MAFLLSFVNGRKVSVLFFDQIKPGTQASRGIPQVELLLTTVKNSQTARL